MNYVLVKSVRPENIVFCLKVQNKKVDAEVLETFLSDVRENFKDLHGNAKKFDVEVSEQEFKVQYEQQKVQLFT